MANSKTMTKLQATELFGLNAEKVRLKHNVSQERFAESIDMSLSMYKRIITGQRQVDAAFALLRLCALYDVHIFELFELDDEIYRMAANINKLDADQREYIDYIICREMKIKEERNR